MTRTKRLSHAQTRIIFGLKTDKLYKIGKMHLHTYHFLTYKKRVLSFHCKF
jgi:hypothetical protein